MMNVMLTPELGSWRFSFQVIGAVGLVWIVAWFALVRAGDLPVTRPRDRADPAGPGIWRVTLSRRMLAVLIMVACINTCWQTLRAWLPKFLEQGRGYAELDARNFNALFFVATDVGCLGAGALTLWLHRRGASVHGARGLVFAGCAVVTALTSCVPVLPQGWALLGVLLLVGAGALGVFPIYHAWTQELSAEHQGKVTGIASVAAWAFAPPAQMFFGRLIDRTGSFDLGLAVAGWLPLLALLALWLLWRQGHPTETAQNQLTPAKPET
jgi:ACS family hexuronate transporter-like MFS transporter